MPENNTKTPIRFQKFWWIGALILVVIIVLLIIFIAAKVLSSNQSTQTNIQNNQTKPQNNPPPLALAPGQTNPNIVGFGQTFECHPRADEEYYRTDKTFVIDPKNPQTMYVNVEYLGFHKSTDGGKTWKLLENGIKAYGQSTDPNKPCYAEYPYALIDPTNSNRIILAVSGAGGTPKDINALSSGILESTDGGSTFTQMIRDDMNGYVSSITFDPTNSSILYYGTNSSPASYMEADPNKIFVKTGLVQKYENNVWTELPTSFNPYTGATGVHVNPKNTKEIVVFTMSAPKPQGGQRSIEGASQMGILRSTDGGATWSKTHVLPSGYEAVLVHDVSKTNFNNMFVTPFTQGGTPKSFYSTDSGLTFKESNKFMDFIVYDPNDSQGQRLLGYAWQGLDGPPVNKLFESTDSGATWHEFANLPAEIKNIGDKKTLISNIVWDPVDKNTFYMNGASGYVWKTVDNGKSWSVVVNWEKLIK